MVYAVRGREISRLQRPAPSPLLFYVVQKLATWREELYEKRRLWAHQKPELWKLFSRTSLRAVLSLILCADLQSVFPAGVAPSHAAFCFVCLRQRHRLPIASSSSSLRQCLCSCPVSVSRPRRGCFLPRGRRPCRSFHKSRARYSRIRQLHFVYQGSTRHLCAQELRSSAVRVPGRHLHRILQTSPRAIIHLVRRNGARFHLSALDRRPDPISHGLHQLPSTFNHHRS